MFQGVPGSAVNGHDLRMTSPPTARLAVDLAAALPDREHGVHRELAAEQHSHRVGANRGPQSGR